MEPWKYLKYLLGQFAPKLISVVCAVLSIWRKSAHKVVSGGVLTRVVHIRRESRVGTPSTGATVLIRLYCYFFTYARLTVVLRTL